jgi:hypothetical protein
MRLFVGVSCLFFLSNHTLFSQRATRIFNPTVNWVSLDQAQAMEPEEVFHLKLKRNKNNTLPDEIFRYTNLRSLSISNMRLNSLPDELSIFQQLTYLDFSRNKIESLPLSICKLSSLEVIVANRNPLGYLPFCMGELSKLIALDLWDTNIVTLPDSMNASKNLSIVDFQGVNLRIEEQEHLANKFPWVKFRFDKPCNCFK